MPAPMSFRQLQRYVLLAGPLLAGAAAMPSSAMAQEKVTFQDHVLPVLRNACLNCHNPDKSGPDSNCRATRRRWPRNNGSRSSRATPRQPAVR